MNYLSFILTTLISISVVADCMGDMSAIVGKFNIIETSKAYLQCDSGKLEVKGCLLKLRQIGAMNVNEISVYANPELCGRKTKEIVEMHVAQECCDIKWGIRCSEGVDGVYPYEPINRRMACLTETKYYIVKYRSLEKGKAVIKVYNETTKAFENSKEKELR